MDAPLQKFSSLKDAPAEFPVWESKLVGRFGIGRERLLKLREENLVEGRDWVKQKRRTCLSLEAVQKLADALGLNGERCPPVAVSALPDPLPKPVLTLKVWGKKISHPKMILATDGTHIFRVFVKTKDHFIPGMEIRAEHVNLDMFNHVGNCPRYRGKY